MHVVSVKIYLAIFAMLMVLTALTVEAASRDLGALNTVVALTIAISKATLVILYFMHVRYSPRFTALVVAVGFLWLAVMIGLTMSDLVSRGWLGSPGS